MYNESFVPFVSSSRLREEPLCDDANVDRLAADTLEGKVALELPEHRSFDS